MTLSGKIFFLVDLADFWKCPGQNYIFRPYVRSKNDLDLFDYAVFSNICPIYFQVQETSLSRSRDPENSCVDTARKRLQQRQIWLITREFILGRNHIPVSIVGEALPRKEIWKLTNWHTFTYRQSVTRKFILCGLPKILYHSIIVYRVSV